MTTARAVRCDKHDLVLSECADCTPRAVLYREPEDLGPWIVAAYHGSCADCGEDIVPGCRIRADGSGRWLCEDCGERTEAAEPRVLRDVTLGSWGGNL